MTRKAYVRVVETITEGLAEPIEIIAGVELSRYVKVSAQYDNLRRTMRYALTPSALRNYSDAEINHAVESAILDNYGSRVSYFIEVGRGKLDQYVQVYQP